MTNDWFSLLQWGLGLPIGWLVWKFRASDAKADKILAAIGETSKDLAVIETNVDNNAKTTKDRFDRIEKQHEAELLQFRDEIKGIKTELRGIRSDFKDGFNTVSERIMDLLTSEVRK